jgi:hypothetical protein
MVPMELQPVLSYLHAQDIVVLVTIVSWLRLFRSVSHVQLDALVPLTDLQMPTVPVFVYLVITVPLLQVLLTHIRAVGMMCTVQLVQFYLPRSLAATILSEEMEA